MLIAMGEDWQAASRRGALQFWKGSLLCGSVVFVLFTSIWWLIKGKPTYNLFELWFVSAVAFGPFFYVLKHLATDAFKW